MKKKALFSIITYTTTDGKKLKDINGASSASITSHTFRNGVGVIRFLGPVGRILSGAFGNCSTLRTISLPDTVDSIGDYAFCFCISLESVVIPDSVTEIGISAFDTCSSLASVRIPRSVTEIGFSAFNECELLGWAVIPDSVDHIGSELFRGCRNMREFVIPSTVKSIGDRAFIRCSGLESIVIPDTIKYIGDSAFLLCTALLDRLAKAGKYYKAFRPGLICRDFKFKKGEVNEIGNDLPMNMCSNGFHCCDNILSLFDYYYGADDRDLVIYEVEPIGPRLRNGHKICCRKIRLKRRIPFSEIGRVVSKSLKATNNNKPTYDDKM